MIIVAGTITYDSAKRAQAEEVVAKARAATRAEAGNLAYDFSIDVADESVVHVFEKWESQAALDEHMVMPHLAELVTAFGDLGVTDVDLKKYEVTSEAPAM